jgi:hypothetical protein
MRKNESRPRLSFSLQPKFIDWVKRNPIDGLHGKNSERRPKRKPEGHGASRGGPKQERHGNKRADLTDSGNREAGIVNRRYIQN